MSEVGLERRIRRLESTLQPRIPINQMQLSRGSIEGEIQFTRTRGGRFQYQVKDGPGVQSFYAGEPLFIDGSNRMLPGSIIHVDEVRALSSAGLKIYDDSGTGGMHVQNGGQIMFFDQNGNESMGIDAGVTDAVNYLTVENAATGDPVHLQAVGGDTNIGVRLHTKGTGALSVELATTEVLSYTSGAFAFQQATTISTPVDTDLTLSNSGTGDVILSAGAAVNIVAGTIDMSAQTVDVTLNAAVDALNFHSNLLSLDVTNSRIGINEAAPTSSLHIVNTDDNANVTVFNLEGKRATPTNNDTMYIYYRMYNDTPASFEYARTTIEAEDITTGSEEGSLLFEVARAGSLETALKMSATTVVVNEPGADRDFRIEAVGAANALFVQGSDGNVGFGTATPASLLTLSAATPQITFQESGTNRWAIIPHAATNSFRIFEYNGSADRFVIDAGGNVGINEASPPSKLAVEGDTRLGDVDANYVEVEANGDANFVGGAGLQYGEIYTADASDTITIAAAGKANKAQVTSFSANGVSNGSVTPDHTNDHITVGKAGHYFCAVSLHVKSVGGGGADTIGYSVYKNNGATEATNLHGQRDLAGGGGDEGSISLSGIIDCAANDTVELWIWNNDSGDDIVVDDVNLSVIQVGGT